MRRFQFCSYMGSCHSCSLFYQTMYIMQMSRKFLTGIILNEFTFSCLCLKHSRLRAVLWLKKNVSDDFPLEVNQEMLKWASSFCPRHILQSSDVAELLSKSPCWIEQKLFKVNSVIFTTIKSNMCGNFGLFCSFSSKLPRIHVGLLCIANENNVR